MEYQNPLEPTVDTPPAKKGLSSFAIAGIGCAVVALLFIVTVGAAAWWVKGKVDDRNFRLHTGIVCCGRDVT